MHEKSDFFPPTGQNSPNDFFVPCAEKRPPSADNPLFASVNHNEQDIIFSRSTLHAQPALVFSLITEAVIVPVTPDTEGCTALPPGSSADGVPRLGVSTQS